MHDLSAQCPQCDHYCGDYGSDMDLTNVTFNCDDCGAVFKASFDVICDTTELIQKGTNWDEEE